MSAAPEMSLQCYPSLCPWWYIISRYSKTLWNQVVATQHLVSMESGEAVLPSRFTNALHLQRNIELDATASETFLDLVTDQLKILEGLASLILNQCTKYVTAAACKIDSCGQIFMDPTDAYQMHVNEDHKIPKRKKKNGDKGKACKQSSIWNHPHDTLKKAFRKMHWHWQIGRLPAGGNPFLLMNIYGFTKTNILSKEVVNIHYLLVVHALQRPGSILWPLRTTLR